MGLEIVPVAVSVRTCGVVLNEDVVWVGDPEASWSLMVLRRLHDLMVLMIKLPLT
jgi:hypothetical protein